MNKWFELLIGLVLVNAVIFLAWFSGDWFGTFWNFKHATWEFFQRRISLVLINDWISFDCIGN